MYTELCFYLWPPVISTLSCAANFEINLTIIRNGVESNGQSYKKIMLTQYDSGVVFYKHRMFIRLAGHSKHSIIINYDTSVVPEEALSESVKRQRRKL